MQLNSQQLDGLLELHRELLAHKPCQHSNCLAMSYIWVDDENCYCHTEKTEQLKELMELTRIHFDLTGD